MPLSGPQMILDNHKRSLCRAEQHVLGLILNGFQGWERAFVVLAWHHFADPNHQLLFGLMEDQNQQRATYDVAAPALHIPAAALEPSIEPVYLDELEMLATPGADDLEASLLLVRQAWMAREVLDLADGMGLNAEFYPEEIVSTIEDMQTNLDRITKGISAAGEGEREPLPRVVVVHHAIAPDDRGFEGLAP